VSLESFILEFKLGISWVQDSVVPVAVAASVIEEKTVEFRRKIPNRKYQI